MPAGAALQMSEKPCCCGEYLLFVVGVFELEVDWVTFVGRVCRVEGSLRGAINRVIQSSYSRCPLEH